jgi:hypothetical protein
LAHLRPQHRDLLHIPTLVQLLSAGLECIGGSQAPKAELVNGRIPAPPSNLAGKEPGVSESAVAAAAADAVFYMAVFLGWGVVGGIVWNVAWGWESGNGFGGWGF